jgi:hypothetical protein
MTDESAVNGLVLEQALEIVRAGAAGPAEGVFGPGSMFWRINREAIVFLGAGRALLLQLAHPWVAAAITEHSRAGDDPIGRFHRTFGVVYTMVFGSLEQALEVARHRLFWRDHVLRLPCRRRHGKGQYCRLPRNRYRRGRLVHGLGLGR